MSIFSWLFRTNKVEKVEVSSSLSLQTTMEELLLQHGWKRYGSTNWIKEEWGNDPKYWYHSLNTSAAFSMMLEEALTLVPDNLRWVNRYSQTSEPDKHGRWARAMYVDDVLYAWITRLDVDGDIRYSARLYFPTKAGNDSPHDNSIKRNFDEIKSWCEKEMAAYFKKVKSYK